MKTLRLSSLGLKVLAAYVVGALLSIALVVAAAVWMVQNDVLADLELAERAGTLAGKVRFNADGQPVGLAPEPAELDWLYDSLPHENAYRVLDAAGQVVLVSKAGEAFWPPDGGGGGGGGSDRSWLARGGFVFERNGMTLHGTTEPFEHQGRRWTLQFATSERLMKLMQRKFALPYMGTGIGLFSAVLIIAFGLCAYVTLRYALKPLRDISEAAAAISPRSLHARLDTDEIPKEIRPLVESFNSALERLERGYRLQQEFLANAAHELKTPLALIRAQIEWPGEDQHARDALLGDVDYMTRQVQQLLLLAEASEVRNYSFATVVVQEVTQEAVTFLQRMGDAANVLLTIRDTTSGGRWRADRGALFTLLKNLLENALQHAPENTVVCVTIDHDTVTVRDQGPGVAAEHLPHLFDRFWRGAHRRDHGAGLGLAICQEIALAHGWRLTVQPAVPAPGLRFQIQSQIQNAESAPRLRSAQSSP